MKPKNDPLEPTPEQCNTRAKLDPSPAGVPRYACWYPQMGGYCGRCVVEVFGPCFDAYVWHDGEFPFADPRSNPDGARARLPVRIHHCDADQFVSFGKWVGGLEGAPE